MSSEHQQQQSPGYDTTAPASRRIIEVAVFVVALLLLLVPFFRSYFKHVTESELFSSEKLGSEGVSKLSEIKAEQKARLESAPLSVKEAAAMLSSAGRGASPVIAPQPSEDLGALEGWTLTKNDVAVEAAKAAMGEPAPEGGAEGEDGQESEGPSATDAEGTVQDEKAAGEESSITEEEEHDQTGIDEEAAQAE